MDTRKSPYRFFIQCINIYLPVVQNPSAFNCNIVWILHNYFFTDFRNLQFQCSILKTGFDIFLLHILSYIETSAASSCVTLPPDIYPITVFFILMGNWCRTNCQISVFQFSLYILLFLCREGSWSSHKHFPNPWHLSSSSRTHGTGNGFSDADDQKIHPVDFLRKY